MFVPDGKIYSRVELETIYDPEIDNAIEIRVSNAERHSNSRFYPFAKTYRKYNRWGEVVDKSDCHAILNEQEECVDIFHQALGIIARRYAIKTNANIDVESVSDKEIIDWLLNSQELPEQTFTSVKEGFMENVNQDNNIFYDIKDAGIECIKTTWQIIYCDKTFSIQKTQKLLVFDKDEVEPSML